jgi:hypothetical protein
VFIVLGKHMEIEFKSAAPRRNPGGHGYRGGRGGRPPMGGLERSETMSRDQILSRWGFKCSIKTLYGTPKG